MKPVNLNEANFESALNQASGPVLVDFWAEWCGPCKAIAPVLDELAVQTTGTALVAKVNVDESPELSARFGVTAIPTLMVFRGGKPVRTLRGYQSKPALLAALAAA